MLFLKLEFVLVINIFAQDNVLEELVKLHTGKLIDLGTNTPDESKNKSVHANILCISWNLANLVIFSRLPMSNKCVKDLEHIVDNKIGSCGYGEFTISVNIRDSDISNVVHEWPKFIDDLFLDELCNVVNKRLDEDVVTEFMRLKKYHTTAGNSSRRSLRKVFNLKHDSHGGLKLNNSS